MMAELILYTNPMSRGRIARWMLEEVGVPYETQILGYGPDGMKSSAYRAINPMGKVPAIRHDGVVVTEVAAICAYLADAFPQAGLAPAHDSRERAPYYRWLFFTAGPLEQAVVNKACGFQSTPEQGRMLGYGSYGNALDALEAAVSAGDYLADGRFTAADLYVGAHLGWGLAFGTIEKRPAFEAYAKRMSERPACRRAAAIDDVLMPKKE
ncbi:glutathione S-transferase family protein [Aureimonas altamirensis]|uniref:glutathione S-transferase family protein n=1 Tax=Aureimonas altamirensis TaxID=370622 RepID=UPI001E578D9F|nr:glutathione S-transferase family protein [Aureimonas altamirensis]UHD46931.1 glutathione S-transferase family protein [Aureimonas altamirensis]